MIRRMVHIDKEKCNGCGLCITACHEGAIELVDGKAQLIKDDYCDGLGNCLPACPTNAITFEDREAAPYDQEAVDRHLAQRSKQDQRSKQNEKTDAPLPCGCPGSTAKEIPMASQTSPSPAPSHTAAVTSSSARTPALASAQAPAPVSQLRQWPVQLKLVPVNAPYFKGAHLLIAADCTAFSCGDFHNSFMRNKITLIGCPKLDEGDYAEKLTAILSENDIKSVSIVRMEVPCCAGIANAAVEALKNCGKMIPWQVTTLSTAGDVLED